MNTEKKFIESIVEGIQEKKGHGIVIADLSEIDGAICKYFVICHGNSPQQVEAIAGSVSDYIREHHGVKPISCVGLGTNQWVAIDYADVLVHIFIPETREYYDLEHLWEDAVLTQIEDID
ncbi:ribosome silencing factor [Prevotella aurantiaca JCM 15754]|uniref:ribosome silencing factor n=1 Tax=Prevotella aurantiaca TaxID=596085 RepID=UPI000468E7D1|nr:ribosome silencing factor [Prevotella aurantiaca]